MKLIKLTLKHFKGIESFEFTPNGNSANIYGDNATGKTTIADAVTYLLFDKDTSDRSPAKFGIKTVDEDGQPIHGLEHTVIGEFMLENGKKLELQKIYKEKWVKKHGSGVSELDGHTTEHFFDEQPLSMSDYKARIEEIMPEMLFKMLTTPSFFAEEMDWKERREVLTQICGDVSDEDVLEANGELEGYLELLDGKSQDAMIDILKKRKSKLNKEIDSIPARIDENREMITEPDASKKEARENVDELKGELEQLSSKLSEIQSGGGVAELNVKVQEIEAEKAEHKNEFQKKHEEQLSGVRQKIEELQDKRDQVSGELSDARLIYKNREKDVDTLEKSIASLKSKMKAEKDRTPDPKPEGDKGPETCPYCNQEIPQAGGDDDHDPDAHYSKYLEEFNEQKAENLRELSKDLDSLHVKLEEESDLLKQAEQSGVKIKGRLNQVEQQLEKARKELAEKKKQIPSVHDDEEYQQLETRQKALLEKVHQAKTDRQSQVDEMKGKIKVVEDQIEEQMKVVRAHDNNERYRARIEELQQQLQDYGKQLNEAEQGLHLIDEFNRTRAEYITDKVNDKFDIVTWRLFKEQQNGGITEVCDPVVGGVPYSEGLNNAARIQAGLDIINTISAHYQKSAPVFVDNAESVTTLPDYGLQLIDLYVNKADKKLRVETAEKEMVAA
jgi:DNA repair exonuclease SbcCD ATPase subunit